MSRNTKEHDRFFVMENQKRVKKQAFFEKSCLTFLYNDYTIGLYNINACGALF